MVTCRSFFMIALLLITPILIHADDIRVSAQLNENEIAPNSPVTGVITIQHDVSQSVDLNSVTLEGAPLHIEFLRDVVISPQSPLRISLYRFQLDPQKPGLHILPSITLKIDGTKYSTTALTYEVSSITKAGNPSQGIIFKLEAYVEAEKPLYIGQQTHIGYRIFYNENFELKDQFLPLLSPEGFKKVGSENLSDIKEKGMSIRQIDQTIEAVKPGTYSLGPSYIIGYRYRQDFRGIKNAVGLDVKAEAPAVEITVKDFPVEGKPTSFNGAVGENIEFKVELLSRPEVFAGDKISISLKFISDSSLSGVKLPELCCQPGFPGFFELGDIPPVPTSDPGSVVYFVEMRPLTDKVTHLPSIEFSYFDPKSEKYVIRRSEAIPLSVTAPPEKVLPMTPDMPRLPNEKPLDEGNSRLSTSDWPKEQEAPQAIEIETIYPIGVSDLSNRYFGTWAVVLIIPLGILALYIQMDIIRRRKKKEVNANIRRARDFLDEARLLNESSPKFYTLLEKAFMTKLLEVGAIDAIPSSYHDLPSEGITGGVKEFLSKVEEARYSKKNTMTIQEILQKAEPQFNKIIEKESNL